jgi:hypothetical protein
VGGLCHRLSAFPFIEKHRRAKFRVELVDIGQESVECTLRPEIGQHVFVAHEAQREGPGPFSTITNISTGTSFGASDPVGRPLESRTSFPRFIAARSYYL